jgi:hypothetical protein
MSKIQNFNENPTDAFEMNTRIYYSTPTPMFQLMAPTDKQVSYGQLNSCREGFCSVFRTNAVLSTKASARKYAMLIKVGSERTRITRINKAKKAVMFINQLEEKYCIEPTKVTLYVGEHLVHRDVFSGDHMVLVVEIDETWASAPALLSMHTLLMRLPQSTVLPRTTKSFDDLVDLVEKKQMRRTRDGGHFYNVKKWLVLLDNLLEVFGDRTAKASWNYTGYNSVHGITQFCAEHGGGDVHARTKLKDIMKSQLAK